MVPCGAPQPGSVPRGSAPGLPHPRRERAGRRERPLLPRRARPRGWGTAGERNWTRGRGEGRAELQPPRRGSRSAPVPAPRARAWAARGAAPPRGRDGGPEPRGREGMGVPSPPLSPARPPPRPALLPRREKGQRCPNKAIGSQELLPKITPLEPGPRLGALL